MSTTHADNQRFLVERSVGTGGMGTVYRAIDRFNGATAMLLRLRQPRIFAYRGNSSRLRLNQSYTPARRRWRHRPTPRSMST